MFKSKEQELYSRTDTWVNSTFNYISLENAEKVLDNMLFDHIESQMTEDRAEDFVVDNDYLDEYKGSDFENYLEFVEDEYEDEFREYTEQDNYPMWSTLFEFRNEPSPQILEAAQRCRFGLINSNDSYNSMLFVSGAGYSFYAQHWIPMFLELPWVSADEFKNVDYSHL